MTISNNIRPTINNKALISIVDKKAPKTEGIFQDNMAKDFPMIPMLVKIYAIKQFTVEVRMNGIKNIGLSINGTPKMIGSEILKNAGTIPTLPTVFNCLDFDLHNNIASDNTDPHPPMTTKYTQKGVVKTLGIVWPASFAAALTDNPLSRIGAKIPEKAASCTPKNQNNCTNAVINTTNTKLSAASNAGAICV